MCDISTLRSLLIAPREKNDTSWESTTMAADAVSIRVRVGDRDHAVLCSSGMLVDELRYVLGSAFEVDAAHIAGLVSDAGVCSPPCSVGSSSLRAASASSNSAA